MQACDDLLAEYQRSPVALGTATPRFTWHGWSGFNSYELIVADAARETQWHTTLPAQPPFIARYAGRPLRSDSTYHWAVRGLTRDAAGSWAHSLFTTALLPQDAWQAPWIQPEQNDSMVERWSIVDWITGAGPKTTPEERLRPVQLVRQRINVDQPVAEARLHATARGVYTAWANGRRIGDEVLAPGFDSYLNRTSVQTYDITSALAPGSNVLAFALSDGWWAGRIGLTGSSAQFGNRTAITWSLYVRYADGHTERIDAAPTAVSTTGGWTYADLFVGEHFDRRNQPAGWTTAAFDDSAWHPTTAVPGDPTTLVPFTGEPIRRVMELAPTRHWETSDGVIIDFGQVIAGRVRLRTRDLPPGRTVRIEHTETLVADGSWLNNIEGINKDQTDVFVSAGGDDEWEPEFTFHGFRYVRITGLTTPLHDSDIVAVVISSDLEQTGSLTTSDDRLNRLHTNVVWSQRANFLSIPTDCPQRERAGWTGDAQVFTAAATNNAFVLSFLSRWLDNLRSDQLPDGRVPIFSPRSPFDADSVEHAEGIGAIVSAAGWSDAIAIVPWTLYERYGDEQVLADNFPALMRWIDYQTDRAKSELPEQLDIASLSAQQRVNHRIMYNTGEQFGDWQTPSTMEGKELHEAIGIAPGLTREYVGPMFQAQTLTIAARIATLLGSNHRAQDYLSRATDVRGAFAAEYVDANGRLPVNLQGLYAIALAFDMIPHDRAHLAAQHLAKLVRDRGNRLDTGFLSTPYLLDVLWDWGYKDLARSVLWQKRTPSWLYAVDQGATTIWESWDAISPDGTPRTVSLNHYALGCVDDWLYRRIAGLTPTAPGWRTARIEPDFDAGLSSIDAHVTTPSGRLAVSVQQEGGRFIITVDVPDGVTAELITPDKPIALPTGRSTHTV